MLVEPTAAATLRITEIFLSLQGESSRVGWPTTFVRLTGCPLRCQYCDTAYAFTGGETMEVATVLERVADLGASYVTVTGGEPLAQIGVQSLLTRLCDRGLRVSLETSGALAIDQVDERVMVVMDVKTPGSGESHRNRVENLAALKANDEVKFVVCDRDDYEWAKATVQKYDLAEICDVLFSPSSAELKPDQLADWILADQLPVRFQLQLHKVLWGDVAGR